MLQPLKTRPTVALRKRLLTNGAFGAGLLGQSDDKKYHIHTPNWLFISDLLLIGATNNV